MASEVDYRGADHGIVIEGQLSIVPASAWHTIGSKR